MPLKNVKGRFGSRGFFVLFVLSFPSSWCSAQRFERTQMGSAERNLAVLVLLLLLPAQTRPKTRSCDPMSSSGFFPRTEP